MSRSIDTFIAELGLKRAAHPTHHGRRGPVAQFERADLNHAVLHRMLEEAEALAPFLKLDRAVVWGLIRDLVLEEAERSPFGLVAREQGAESAREPATLGSTSLQDVLAEHAKLADTRHGRPKAPEWAVALDAEDQSKG
jgi:hypothetical protein